MCCVTRISLAILMLNVFSVSYGYQWIQIPRGDPLPKDIVQIHGTSNYNRQSIPAYVGRARHFDEVLPAEVYNSSLATIFSCSKTIYKRHFEILVAKEGCQWGQYVSFKAAPENIVHIGYYKHNEPIYGAKYGYNSNYEISSLLLTSQKIISLNSNANYILTCNSNEDWVDVSATLVPNNAISGGLSHKNQEIYVGRLRDGCKIVAGQVIPELHIAINEKEELSSTYGQILVGESDGYAWKPVEGGLIPDYAVVSGKIGNELQYVARMNKSIGYLTYSLAVKEENPYEILVKS